MTSSPVRPSATGRPPEEITIASVDVRDAEPYVLAVLRSGRLAQGAMVERLEVLFARTVGTAHAVAVNNGTSALTAALEVLDLKPGDEVITSPFTFGATLNAVLETGATARFADISEIDFGMCSDAAAALVNDNTRVLLPVHLFGQPVDMGRFGTLAEANGLAMVEDAAQAVGATYCGRGVGSFGLGCFSLYATKNVTTGEGGMITTDDDRLAERLRLVRNQGMRRRYEYEVVGHNYRMTDLHAAVGVPQMLGLAARTKRRRDNAAHLSSGLAGLPGIVLPTVLPQRTHVWHQYTIRVTGDAPISRDELVSRLAERGIETGCYYPKPVFDYRCYRDHPRVVFDDVPVATRVAGQVLSLPVHPDLTAAVLAIVVDTMWEVLDR